MWSLRTIPASVIATGPIGRRLPTRSTKISEIVEDFLKLQGFDYYGLPETEKPLIGFFGHDAIRGIYLHGAKRPDLISLDNLESDFGFMQRPDAVRLNLDLFSIGTLGNSLKQSPIKTGKRSRSS